MELAMQTDTTDQPRIDHLLGLARMTDQERCHACAQELQLIYRKWHCEPMVLSSIANGLVTVTPGIRALPIQLK